MEHKSFDRVQLRNTLLLVLGALIWGVAFVAQSVGSGYVGAYTFLAARSWLACAFLLGLLGVRRAVQRRRGVRVPFWLAPKKLAVGGALCGAALFAASAAQQMGVGSTSTAKAGFLTALYVVIVPVLGLLAGRRPGARLWVCVAVSVAGLYLLCIGENFSIAPGDGLLILCALCFSGHILVVDHFSRRTDCVKMSCLQFATASVLCMGVAVFTEPIDAGTIVKCAVPLLYAGVLSGAVGYTLQIVAQKDTDPTVASLLMSLESVFAVLAGWVLLGDMLTAREALGCVLMMGGIVLAQLKS